MPCSPLAVWLAGGHSGRCGATVPSEAFCDGPCARPRANAWSQIYRRLEDPTESASAAYRRAGTRTRRETSPCAPQCKPVEVGRRDRLPRRARVRRLLRAFRRVPEGTADGARRRTSSRRTYFDRGLALKARSETLAGEFASMTAVPTISDCCGGRPRLPQHLRRKAHDPGTRRRPATRRRFRGRFRCPRRVFFADEKTLPSRGLFGRTVAYDHADVRAAL